MTPYLFTFTFSPVQSFIAEARRGQDLFAGSYILSQLAGAAWTVIKALPGAETIYPPTKAGDMPNKMTLEAPDKAAAERMGREARDALIRRWGDFAKDARAVAHAWGTKPDTRWEAIWDRQVNHVWECYWAAVPMTADYRADFKNLTALLDANKRLRAFEPATEDGLKDSLSGNRSALRLQNQDAEAYWKAVFETTPNRTRIFNNAKLRKDGRERLDAIGVVKRFLDNRDLPDIRSTSSIASEPFLQKARKCARNELSSYVMAVRKLIGAKIIKVRRYEPGGWAYDGDLFYIDTLTPERLKDEYGVAANAAALADAKVKLNDLYRAVGKASKDNKDGKPEKPCLYYAILQMDGDGMGEYISQLPDKEAHKKFSQRVSTFSAQVAKVVNDRNNDRNGAAVYTGGDDVLALLPLEEVLPRAQELVKLFAPTGRTLSAGIAIVHHTQPLSLALRMAGEAEKKAKHIDERNAAAMSEAERKNNKKNAVAVRAAKRSGGDVQAVAKWARMNTFEAARKAIAEGKLSSKCAYDVREAADHFMPIPGVGAALQPMQEAMRTSAFKSQLRQQVGRHWKPLGKDATDAEKAADRQRRDTLLVELEAWLDEPGNDPQQLGDWLVLARFVALRGEE